MQRMARASIPDERAPPARLRSSAMDPRAARSRAALHAAVLEATREQPIAAVSAAALCRAAGVTRDTFYRHAASPAALLADALRAELVGVIATFGDDRGRMLAASGGFRAGTRGLLAHVAEHEVVYRHAMQADASSEVRAMLVDVIRGALVAHALAEPGGGDDALALEVAAAYAAAGTVGAIDAWMRSAPLDVERGTSLIMAASPDYWLASTGEEHPTS